MKKRTLVLIRHGKAVEAEDFKGTDFDRPLTEKAEKDIERIGKFLRLSGVRPDILITSPAIRAYGTAEILKPLYKGEDFRTEEDIYIFDLTDFQKFHAILASLDDDDIETAFFIGHNNSLTQFAEHLMGASCPPLKKGSALVLRSNEKSTWEKITEGGMEPIYYVTPTFLREE